MAKTKGNRLSVPAVLGGTHFIYHTDPPSLPQNAVSTVIRYVREHIRDLGVRGSEIALFTYRDLISGSEELKEARGQLVKAIENPVLVKKTADVLACRWTPIHVDDTYAGSAFYSVVLDTGPEPYVLDLCHTRTCEYNRKVLWVENTAKELRKGDAFIFDPTTPHYAAPATPHQDCLLILLQTELSDKTLAQRNAILKHFAPNNSSRAAF